MFEKSRGVVPGCAALAALLLVPSICIGQSAPLGPPVVEAEDGTVKVDATSAPGVQTTSANRAQEPPRSTVYVDQASGASAADFVRQARSANAELAAARVEIERAPASLPKLREELASPLISPPASEEEALRAALASRPDLRLARLNEAVARAGLRLARAEGRPTVDLTTRYTTDRSITDLPEPLVPVPDRSRTLTFGVSIGLPVFNRNQGAKAEAEAAIRQAELRTAFAEATVRSEVAAAFARVRAADQAVAVFEQGVLARSADNVRVLREAYQLGEFPVTDLLAEQRKLAESQRDYTELLAEHYRALVDLQSAIGLETQPAGSAGPSTSEGATPAASPDRVNPPSTTTFAEEPR